MTASPDGSATVVESEQTVRDPHRCGWGSGCANPDRRDQDNPRPAVIIDGTICEGCMWRLTKVMRWMVADFVKLHRYIGERGSAAGQRVHGTRDPGIPINVATEALMRRLVEAVDRAASVVESELGMTGVARARSDSPPDGRTGRGYLAANGRRHTTPSDALTVDRGARILQSTLDVLVDAEPDWHQVWLPLPDGDEEADRYPNGQPHELVALSGLDLARELVNIHRLVGMQLGLTRLRTPSDCPCHRCGNETLGRDNGCWDIDCTTCGARYTEDEHGFLIRCTVDESQSRDEDQLLKYLLAEAYYRLDKTRERTDTARTQLDLGTIESVMADGPEQVLKLVQLVVDQCAAPLTLGPTPHPRPEERQIGAREHEKKLAKRKQLDAKVAADAAEARKVKRKELPAGVTYSTETTKERSNR